MAHVGQKAARLSKHTSPHTNHVCCLLAVGPCGQRFARLVHGLSRPRRDPPAPGGSLPGSDGVVALPGALVNPVARRRNAGGSQAAAAAAASATAGRRKRCARAVRILVRRLRRSDQYSNSAGQRGRLPERRTLLQKTQHPSGRPSSPRRPSRGPSPHHLILPPSPRLLPPSDVFAAAHFLLRWRWKPVLWAPVSAAEADAQEPPD